MPLASRAASLLSSVGMTASPSNDERRLNHQLDRFERRLPRWLGRALRWLRIPSARWVRIPLGLLLVLAGVFSFLPLLGLWMLPLGLLLLAEDVPMMQRARDGLLNWIEHRWPHWVQ